MRPGTSKAGGALSPSFSTLLVGILLAAAFGTAALAQARKPITRQKLVAAVRMNGYSTTELVAELQARGVDFQMTADAEQELRSVGARPEVIEAARSNYRAAASSAPATTAASQPSRTQPSRTNSPVPPGPPLSKNEIVTMLQGGIASARVEQFVEARGVTFAVTPDVTAEIKAAGGDRSLLGAISEKATTTTTASSPASRVDSPFGPSAPNGGGGADYDDYMDRVASSWSAQDWNSAIRYAQQAVQLDASRPQAYQILGMMLLYSRNDFAGAEQAMRAAIDRGGSAAFIVFHDHGTGQFQQYCKGTMFVSKTGVSFKADDGQDTFETADSNIKEAKTNGFFGSEVGAFHIKPVQQINGRGNFNFAPATRNRAEAQLLIRLIGAY